jgi:hypothetical protein
MKFLPLAGTHGWNGQLKGEWWQEGSPFLAFMSTQGWEPYNAEDPFVWDTGIGGVPWKRSQGWYAAGLNLKHYDCFSGEPVRIIAHSHGGQVAAFAAAKGLRIESLITIGTPFRADMKPIWEAALPKISNWTHVHSDWSDRTQLLGSMFDGAFGIQREFLWEDPLGVTRGATRNVALPGVGHSGILRDPEHFALWIDKGILKELHGLDKDDACV